MRDLLGLPAIGLSLGVLSGLWLELRLTDAPHPALLVALTGVALAARRPWGPSLAGLAFGVLVGVVDDRPGREELLQLAPSRAVEAVLEVSAPAQRWGETWMAPIELRMVRQGERVRLGGGAAWLSLGGSRAPVAGSRLRVRGYLSRSVGFANFDPPRSRPAWRLRVKSWQVVEVERPPGRLGRLQWSLRERAVELGGQGIGPALARALVLGESRSLPDRVVGGLRRTGLFHLLSLSGLHVAMLGGLVLLLASPLGRHAQRLLAALAILAYVMIAGPYPALLRAVAMGLLAILALTLRRRPLAPNALAVAAAILAGTSPSLIDDLGFQLSCSATAGLILLAGPLGRRFSRLPAWLARSLGATLGAQIASLPWALPALATFSPVSPLLNLLAVPWTSLVLACSLGWFSLVAIAPSLAVATAPILDRIAFPVILPARLPPSSWVTLACPAGFPAAVGLSTLGASLFLLPKARRRSLGMLIALALLDGGGRRPAPSFEVAFLDVGQGDAILLRDGDSAALVDGGGVLGLDLAQRVLLPSLAHLGLHRLELVALTHPDFDHCGGLRDLAATMPIDRLVLPSGLADSGCVGDLATSFHGRTTPVATGSELAVGRWRLRVLWPPPDRGPAGENDRSLVLVAAGGGRTVLLSGDLEVAGERALLARDSVPACDVLKVGHHGGERSSSREWLAAVAPRLAVLSCGIRNRYGHPSPGALSRLAAQGARLLRTDRDGVVVLRWKPSGPLGLDLPASPR